MKNNKQITAVEWLINELGLDNHLMGICDKELNKALEMEKQQIIDAYEDGRKDQKAGQWSSLYHRHSRGYYRQRFKTE